MEWEKERLLAELGEAEKKALKISKEDGQVCVEKAMVAKKTESKPRSKPRKRVNRNKKEGDK